MLGVLVELLSWSTLFFIIWIGVLCWLLWTLFKMVRSHNRILMPVLFMLAGLWLIAGFLSAQRGSLEQAVEAIGGFVVSIAGSYLAVAVGIALLLLGIGATFRDKTRESSRLRSRGATRVEPS